MADEVVDYEEAARREAVSGSTLKRRVRAGVYAIRTLRSRDRGRPRKGILVASLRGCVGERATAQEKHGGRPETGDLGSQDNTDIGAGGET